MSRVVNLEVVEGSGTLGPGPALALKVVYDIIWALFYFIAILKGEHLGSERRRQQTSILAPRVVTHQPGDTLNLDCVVTEHQVPPPYFTW